MDKVSKYREYIQNLLTRYVSDSSHAQAAFCLIFFYKAPSNSHKFPIVSSVIAMLIGDRHSLKSSLFM